MAGLPRTTLDYLADLERHNDKDWFAEHRDRYDQQWLAPAMALVDDLAAALPAIDRDLRTEARVNRGILRIHRDRRFGGLPYKPHLDVVAWHGPHRTATRSWLYLRVHPDRVDVATGVRRLEGDRLRRFRDLVTSAGAGGELVAAVAGAVRAGATLSQPDLQAPPRAHPSNDHDRVALLRRRSCLVTTTSPPPGIIDTARFVPWVVRRWQVQQDVHQWLVAHLPS